MGIGLYISLVPTAMLGPLITAPRLHDTRLRRARYYTAIFVSASWAMHEICPTFANWVETMP